MLLESDLHTHTDPGRYGDGNNLYLVVDKAGRRRWVFLYRFGRRRHEVGLGGLHEVSLGEARAKAAAARKVLDEGVDPFPGRRSNVPLFGELARQHIDGVVAGSSQQKHVTFWNLTLFNYARPICALPVNKIATEDILAVLERHWKVHPATAMRVRAHIEIILDVATARGYRSGANPATWPRHLVHLLPGQPPQCPRAFVPWREIPGLVRDLRSPHSVTSSCLIFTILTGAMASEVVAAERAEFDLDGMLWTIPIKRSSSSATTDGEPAFKRRIPLSRAAVQLLIGLWSTGGRFAFERPYAREPITARALLNVLRSFNDVATLQGFRKSFDMWAIEATHFTSEIRSLALGKTPALRSRRSESIDFAIDKRRELFEAWAAHCYSMPAD